jgi:hypothetical protein
MRAHGQGPGQACAQMSTRHSCKKGALAPDTNTPPLKPRGGVTAPMWAERLGGLSVGERALARGGCRGKRTVVCGV